MVGETAHESTMCIFNATYQCRWAALLRHKNENVERKVVNELSQLCYRSISLNCGNLKKIKSQRLSQLEKNEIKLRCRRILRSRYTRIYFFGACFQVLLFNLLGCFER